MSNTEMIGDALLGKSVRAHAEYVRNLSLGQFDWSATSAPAWEPFFLKCRQAICMMKARVLDAIHCCKILRAIIVAHVVDVMHVFGVGQQASKFGFQNQHGPLHISAATCASFLCARMADRGRHPNIAVTVLRYSAFPCAGINAVARRGAMTANVITPFPIMPADNLATAATAAQRSFSAGAFSLRHGLLFYYEGVW